jgi:hypothetical protein
MYPIDQSKRRNRADTVYAINILLQQVTNFLYRDYKT